MKDSYLEKIKLECQESPFLPVPDPESLLGIRFEVKEEYQELCICEHSPPFGKAECWSCNKVLL